MKKTWRQKLADQKSFPKVLKLEKRFPCYNAVHKMGAEVGDPVVLVNASEIGPLVAEVPKGKVITIWDICRAIARKHRVKACCSLATGIFIMAIANAVEESIAEEDPSPLARIPYRRTLKADGFLNEKYPGGLEAPKNRLLKEGHRVIARGKKSQVADWEKHLWRL